MSGKTGRALALTTLAVGLIAWPALAAPPHGSSGQAGKGNSVPGSARVIRGATGTPTGRTTATNSATTNNNGVGNIGGSNVTNGNNANNKEKNALSLLHDARHELSGSHFAYDGHRARAMKEIQRAIKDLTPPNPNPGQQVTQQHAAASAPKGNSKPHGTQIQTQKTPPKEKPPQTQAESDAKLRAALRYLTRAHGKVHALNADAGENVEAAISELNLALGGQ